MFWGFLRGGGFPTSLPFLFFMYLPNPSATRLICCKPSKGGLNTVFLGGVQIAELQPQSERVKTPIAL